MEIENNIESIKYCKDLLGICFTDPDEPSDQYFHAYSFDKNTLIDMINDIDQSEKNYYSIKNIKLYRFLHTIQYDSNDKLNKKNVSGILLKTLDEWNYNTIIDPIYGFNYIKNNDCEQVLLSTNNSNSSFLQNSGISYNPIIIDTFYSESILNA